jgi:hypothetical protein
MDTLHHMNSLLREMEQRSDQRSAFLHCYSLMSGNMVLASREGAFHDCEWMQHFVDHFARYYFQALDQYNGVKESAPSVWVLAHDTALHTTCPTIQKLLLGINAHINYDLVLTLADLLEKEWPGLDNSGRTRRYEDYCKVNEIIAETIDKVQDLVLESSDPEMELVDFAMGRVDEWLISRLIRTWRDEVWETAVELLEMPDASRREKMRQDLETRTLARGEAILFKKGLRSLKDLW